MEDLQPSRDEGERRESRISEVFQLNADYDALCVHRHTSIYTTTYLRLNIFQWILIKLSQHCDVWTFVSNISSPAPPRFFASFQLFWIFVGSDRFSHIERIEALFHETTVIFFFFLYAYTETRFFKIHQSQVKQDTQT